MSSTWSSLVVAVALVIVAAVVVLAVIAAQFPAKAAGPIQAQRVFFKRL
jgi:hypothetical protein